LAKDFVEELITPKITRGLLITLAEKANVALKFRSEMKMSTSVNWRAAAKFPTFTDGHAPIPYWDEFVRVAHANGVPENEYGAALLFANVNNSNKDVPSYIEEKIVNNRVADVKGTFINYYTPRNKEDIEDELVALRMKDV